MTDPIRAGASPWMREMQRLHAQQQAANATKDPEQIAHAAEELTMFLRYSGNGRLDEWLARQRGTVTTSLARVDRHGLFDAAGSTASTNWR